MDSTSQKPTEKTQDERGQGSTSTVDLSSKCEELVCSRDAFMKKLVTVSPSCVLYSWEEGAWKEMGIDAPLAIYHRYDVPLFSLMVCPEEEADREVLPIRADIKLRLKEPHIRVHKTGAPTIAIWLASDEECKRIYRVLKLIRKRVKQNTKAPATLADVEGMLESSQGDTPLRRLQAPSG